MKLYPFSLILLAASTASAEQSIYWTGNLNAWGGGEHMSFSATPGGTDYVRLYGADNAPEPQIYHHYYDAAQMQGTNTTVLMNRIGQVMLSMTISSAEPGSGFRFDTVTNNSLELKLDGPVTVTSGLHQAFNAGAAEGITLLKDAVWDLAEGTRMIWRIPLLGQNGTESFTLNGAGTLIMRDTTLAYGGPTRINAGTFGGSATITGDLHFAAGSRYYWGINAITTVNGTVSFENFSILDIVNLSASSPIGSYPIIMGNVDTANLGNLGAANAHELGDGVSTWFEYDEQVLRVVVSAPAWAHYRIIDSIGDVETGSMLGRINIQQGDWIYSYDLENWIYLPESAVNIAFGAWGFVVEGN